MPSGKPANRGGPVLQGRPVHPGDLQAVRGIGPKVEASLKAAGIENLGQLARTPANEVAAVLAEVRGKFDIDRIVREGWLAQAAALAAVPGSAAREGGAPTAEPVRHSFTVELRLPLAGRDVVSSKVVHVQTGDADTWTSWDPQRIVAFIEDRSRVRRGGRSGARSDTSSPPRSAPGRKPSPASGSGKITPRPARESPDDPRAAVHAYATVPASGPGIAGGRAAAVTAILTFDSAALRLPASQPATVQAEVFARELLAGRSVLVGSSLAAFSPDEHVRLDIACELSAVGRPITLFAVVRVLAGDGDARQPAQDLTGATLAISRPAQDRQTARPGPRAS